MYASTLLSLLTTLQVTLHAHGKYLNSVIQTEKQEHLDEKMRERMEREREERGDAGEPGTR